MNASFRNDHQSQLGCWRRTAGDSVQDRKAEFMVDSLKKVDWPAMTWSDDIQ
jgi:hypothetical protein